MTRYFLLHFPDFHWNPWHLYNSLTRVVKRSSDLRTSNFKFEFPFDIRMQTLIIRRRRFCLESGALRCTVWRFLCSLRAVNSSDVRLFAYPSPALPAYRRGVQLLSLLHCTPGVCCILMQAIKLTNLGGPDTDQTSIDGNRARHGLTS